MSTPKEILYETIKTDGRPERLLKQYEAFKFIRGTPISMYLNAGMVPGATYKNRWGVTFAFPKGEPGPMPLTGEEVKVCRDVTKWRGSVHAPDLLQNCTNWAPCLEQLRQEDCSGVLPSSFMPAGIFEQLHQLMGFEDTLMNLYEEPEAMKDLIDYILQHKLLYAQLLIDNLPLEAIVSHDDWGARDRLFMSPDMWREFFKEPYRELYGYIRSRGVLVVHHADSYLVPIVEDMVDIGIDIWQGVLPGNDIPTLQKQLQGRMTLMGGVGAAIDRGDAGEEEIRSHVMALCRSCGKAGHFIPCITYGAPGTVFPHVDPVIDRTIDEYNRS